MTPARLLVLLIFAAMVADCTPAMRPATNQVALPEFAGVSVGRTVMHSPCRGEAGCFDCFEYCPSLKGWTTRIRWQKPEYASDSQFTVVGVDNDDVVQVMEVNDVSGAEMRSRTLTALRAAFGPGEEQAGRHIVWHPAGGLVDFRETSVEPQFSYNLYIFSPAARAALPTLLTGDTSAGAGPRRISDAIGVFGINLGADVPDCEALQFPVLVTALCFDHSLATAFHDPHLLFLQFPRGSLSEILSSGAIRTETDATGIQSISMWTRGLAVQEQVMRDLKTMFGPPQQVSGGGVDPITAQWTLGDRTVLFQGVVAFTGDGSGILHLWTPQGKIYEDEALANRRGSRPLIPLLRYTPPK